jgi:ABC-2 type transport system permease protein
MRPFWALLRKQIVESRWTLGLSAAALFGLGWLFVYVTSLNEVEILRLLESDSEDWGGRIQWMRNLGVTDRPASAAIMMAFWNHPFIILLICIWAIGRGSAAVSAEIERGTLDLILSRPVSRSTYLASQVLVATVGLLILAEALLAGASMAVRYNVLREPPTAETLFKPALNLCALGLPIYGYTLLASALDHVRWRPTSIGSVLTLGGFIAYVISMIPVLKDMSWKPWLERISIFKAYNPVELVTTGESLQFNLLVLSGIGVSLIALAFVAFAIRDLPTNG